MGRASAVVLASCPDYDPERVSRALEESLALIRFAGVPSSKPVLLKPNMLLGSDPDRGVTTHPAVFAAAARYFKTKGFSVVFGDSPNGMFKPRPVARRCGILAAAQSLGVSMADFESGEDVSYPAGVQNKRFHVATGVMASGFIVNLPKLKTHALTTMTGALKNMFGVIPGMRKAEFHLKHPDVEGFSRMIADLNGLVRSGLVVMDAVKAMEGNGPSGGSLVDIGLLLISRDPVAVDAAACRLIGVDPLSIDVIRMAEESGLGNASPGGVRILTIGGARVEARQFALPFRGPPGGKVPRVFFRFARNLAMSKPFIDAKRCARCGQCVEACPARPKALQAGSRGAGRRCRPGDGQGGRRAAANERRVGGRQPALSRNASDDIPHFTYRNCIRCYCCQEICPHGAISIQPSLFGRIFENTSGQRAPDKRSA
jgi:uncharacterized protein (DUF362 family)/ferredoxin